MSRRPPELIIVGGQIWATTAELAGVLARGEPGRPRPDLLVWDERDVDDRWAGRSGTYVVRSRPIRRWLADHGRPTLAGHVDRIGLRAHLRPYRDRDVVMVGWVALGASPWLQRHRGFRCWLPTTDDRRALVDRLPIPSAEQGGPHVIVTSDLDLARLPGLRSDARLRWEPGLRWSPPASTPAPTILALGPPDRTGGIDLLGRALAQRSQDLRATGASVRWLAPLGAGVPDDEAADLRQSGIADLLEVTACTDPWRTLAELAPSATAIALCGRPGAWRPAVGTLLEAYRCGVQVAAFDDGPPPELALDDRWSRLRFGDVAGLAAALVIATTRPVGPIGLADLLRTERARG